MNKWKPITKAEFADLFDEQYAQLSQVRRSTFDKFRVPFWLATITRSEAMGDEKVFVVAQVNGGVLYFDDVEYGFNISVVCPVGKILTPGGSQNTLEQALNEWFVLD